MRAPATSLTTALALVVGGCADEGHDTLQAFLDDATPPSTAAAPTPAAPAPAPFSYAATALRDPFQPKEAAPNDDASAGTPPAPNLSRPKQPLERFSIGQLRMVGTLSHGRWTLALVQDAQERVHRVRRGDFLGTDFGQARAIDAAGIDVVETISDGAGGWAWRERRIALTTHSDVAIVDLASAPAEEDGED